MIFERQFFSCLNLTSPNARHVSTMPVDACILKTFIHYSTFFSKTAKLLLNTDSYSMWYYILNLPSSFTIRSELMTGWKIMNFTCSQSYLGKQRRHAIFQQVTSWKKIKKNKQNKNSQFAESTCRILRTSSPVGVKSAASMRSACLHAASSLLSLNNVFILGTIWIFLVECYQADRKHCLRKYGAESGSLKSWPLDRAQAIASFSFFSQDLIISR